MRVIIGLALFLAACSSGLDQISDQPEKKPRPATSAEALNSIQVCRGFDKSINEWLTGLNNAGWRLKRLEPMTDGARRVYRSDFGILTTTRQQLKKGYVGTIGRCEFTFSFSDIKSWKAAAVDLKASFQANNASWPSNPRISPNERLYFQDESDDRSIKSLAIFPWLEYDKTTLDPNVFGTSK